MHSRRDQVEAHGFVVNRLRGALVAAQPDVLVTPLRRTPLGLTIGSLVALAAAGLVTLLALISPGSAPGWRQPGALIVEKETGNRYLLSGGVLHPVLNFASARLLLGTRLTVDSVKGKTIADVPRGLAVGIPGAPDDLPAPAAAGDQPWVVCTGGPATAPTTTVLLGTPLPDESSALLVSGPDGRLYLIRAGVRMMLGAPWVATALDLLQEPVPVPVEWLRLVPAGPAIGPLPIGERGTPGPELDGRASTVGQVLTVTAPGAPERYFVVDTDGLMPIGPTAARLALGDPAAAAAYPGRTVAPLPISPPALSQAPVLSTPAEVRALPDLAAGPVDPGDRSPCVRIATAKDAPAYGTGLLPRATLEQAGAPVAGTWAPVPGVRVHVPPGAGVLARSAREPGSAGGLLFLVTGSGAKYPVADDGTATALGYVPAAAATVPGDLLGLLPTGPALRAERG